MPSKIGFREIDLELYKVNRALLQTLDVYRIVKKHQSPGYEVHRRVGLSSAFECVSGDIGLTKEGVISALCIISHIHPTDTTTSAANSNADFDKALADLNDEKLKPWLTSTTGRQSPGATLEQKAKFDADLADLLADDEEDAMNSEAED